MADLRVEKMAELLVNYSVAVKPGDKVAIQGDILAEPLLKAIYVKVLQAGGNPFIMASLTGLDELFYRYASDEQLKYVPPPTKLIMDTYDVRISIGGDENTRALSGVNPAKLVMFQQARTEIMKTFLQRAAKGEMRWTYALFPTNAYAQDSEMGLAEYEDFVYNACLGDVNDPIGYWKRFSAEQQKTVDWLKGKNRSMSRCRRRIYDSVSRAGLSVTATGMRICLMERSLPGRSKTAWTDRCTFPIPPFITGGKSTESASGLKTAVWSKPRLKKMRIS